MPRVFNLDPLLAPNLIQGPVLNRKVLQLRLKRVQVMVALRHLREHRNQFKLELGPVEDYKE